VVVPFSPLSEHFSTVTQVGHSFFTVHLIAGVRLTEIFSDWTYLLFRSTITVPGWIGLLVSPLANLLFSWILIRTWKKVTAIAQAAVLGCHPGALRCVAAH
jgi:hypothetical protein